MSRWHPETVIERFEAKYIPEPNSGCWLWIGSVNEYGYGSMRVARNRLVKAHRLSLELVGRRPPANLDVCHKCDTPSCVNPDHLFLGDAALNAADMKRKKRQNRGEQRPQSKLKKADVAAIRSEQNKHLTSTDLCKTYGVTPSCIRSIRQGARWTYLIKENTND